MKTLFKNVAVVFFLGFFMMSGMVMAQKLKENSVKITLSGTSTIHEWDMLSTEGAFSGKLEKNGINDVAFVVPVKSLVSGKSAMDRNTYQAMNAEKYPNIVFTSDRIETLSGNAEVKGKLIINNVMQEVLIPMTVTKEEGGYILQGFTQINMRSFKVEPPLFMMGAVKTGEVVSVKFIISVVEAK